MDESNQQPEKPTNTPARRIEEMDVFDPAEISMEKHFLVHAGKKALEKGLWPAAVIRNNDTRALSRLHSLAADFMKSRGDLFGVAVKQKSKRQLENEEFMGEYFNLTAKQPSEFTLTRSRLGQRFLEIFRTDYSALKLEYPNHRVSPFYVVFVNVSQQVPGSLLEQIARFRSPETVDHEITLQAIASDLNRIANVFRLQWQSVAERYANFSRSAVENCNEFLDIIEKIRACETEVMVLHIDTHEFPANHQIPAEPTANNECEDENHEPSEEAPKISKQADYEPPVAFGLAAMLDSQNWEIEHTELLDVDLIKRLDEMKAARVVLQGKFHQLFKNRMIGYVWCLEFGTFRGWHFHWLIFLMPTGKHENDVELVDILGASWLEARPNGDYYNGNEDKKSQKYLAAGLVRMNDPRAIEGLRYKALYMTAAGLFVSTLVPRFCRTLGRSAFARTGPKQPKAPWRKRLTWRAMCRRIGWM